MKLDKIAIVCVLLLVLLSVGTVAQEDEEDDPAPQMVHTIEVWVVDEDNDAVDGAKIVVTHLRANSSATIYSGSNGFAYVALNELVNPYYVDDDVLIVVTKGSLTGRDTVPISSSTHTEVTITISEVSLEDEVPSDVEPDYTTEEIIGIGFIVFLVVIAILCLARRRKKKSSG